MKLLYFTSTKAVHSQKWLQSMSDLFEVHVACFLLEPIERVKGVTYHELKPTGREKITTPGVNSVSSASISQEAWLTFKNGLKFSRAFANIIDQVKPDILHAHQSVPFGWYALTALARAHKKIPLVVSVWGTDVMAYPEHSWLFRLLNRRVLKRSTAVTATSKALVTAAKRWSPCRDYLVIPFGVDTKRFSTKSNVPLCPRVFGMAKNLRFIGDLDVYGFTVALRAIAIARRCRPNLSLEIAGAGPAKLHLMQLVDNLGLQKAVKFLGEVPQQRMDEVMRRWDVLLLPSKQESFGVTAVEAASLGIPVIASHTGGLPEIVQHGITGVLLKPMTAERLADAILALDAKLLTSAHYMGPKIVAERFTWEKSVLRMKQLYEALL
ncbi:MAG: glycosyltransferase [Parcubacteria group bacterium]